MNVQFGDGQSATLRETLSYAQARGVRAAMLATQADVASAIDVDIALVKAYLVSWNVLDAEGHAVSGDTPEDAPDRVIQTIALAAIELWNGKPNPKGTTARSRTTPRALRSA